MPRRLAFTLRHSRGLQGFGTSGIQFIQQMYPCAVAFIVTVQEGHAKEGQVKYSRSWRTGPSPQPPVRKEKQGVFHRFTI
jgi:hypothetical protein